MWMVRVTAAALSLSLSAGSAEAALEPPMHESMAAVWPNLADGIAAMKRGEDFIAFEVLRRFAEQGNRTAQFDLATLYLRGRGTPTDREAAKGLFEAAAEQSMPIAMAQLASLYRQDGDLAKALSWYRRGAAQGDPDCLFGLALMYQGGEGVRASEADAAKFYRMAALRGHAKAQLILGVMTYQGRGVPKDLLQAYRWFALAQSSLPPGVDRERSIRAMTLIEVKMTAEQLSVARDSAVTMGVE